jgi:hypothetical protein
MTDDAFNAPADFFTGFRALLLLLLLGELMLLVGDDPLLLFFAGGEEAFLEEPAVPGRFEDMFFFPNVQESLNEIKIK